MTKGVRESGKDVRGKVGKGVRGKVGVGGKKVRKGVEGK
jgi:hypothetical protein